MLLSRFCLNGEGRRKKISILRSVSASISHLYYINYWSDEFFWTHHQKRLYFNFPWWHDVYTILFYTIAKRRLYIPHAIKRGFISIFLDSKENWNKASALLIDIELRKWMSKSILTPLLIYTLTTWLTRIRFTWISLTWLFKRFPFLT